MNEDLIERLRRAAGAVMAYQWSGDRERMSALHELCQAELAVADALAAAQPVEPAGTPVTVAEAAEALDSLDDYARMYGVDAIGPRETLEKFIAQQKAVEDDGRVRALREGEVMGAYMDFDRTADRALTPTEYLVQFGQYVSQRTAEVNNGERLTTASARG